MVDSLIVFFVCLFVCLLLFEASLALFSIVAVVAFLSLNVVAIVAVIAVYTVVDPGTLAPWLRILIPLWLASLGLGSRTQKLTPLSCL